MADRAPGAPMRRRERQRARGGDTISSRSEKKVVRDVRVGLRRRDAARPSLRWASPGFAPVPQLAAQEVEVFLKFLVKQVIAQEFQNVSTAGLGRKSGATRSR